VPVANTVFRLKLEDASDATKSVETEATVAAANTWETLTFNFGTPATGTAALNTAYTFNKASIFPNFNNKVDASYYVDDLKFVGVSGVSQICPAASVAGVPSLAATPPTNLSGNVIALYSNTYTPVATSAFPTNWSNPNAGTDLTIGSNTAKKLANLVFAGLEPSAVVNLTTFTTVNISVWTATGTSFKVKLVDYGANGVYGIDDVEHEVTLTAPTQNAWTYYAIPLSSFTGLTTKAALGQIIISGSTADYFIDDIYFSK